MTATQVIAEIDRLPPDEQQTVFLHLRMLEDETIPDSFLQAMAEAERGALIPMENGSTLTAAQWMAARRPLRPTLPGAVDAFIADRRRDRA